MTVEQFAVRDHSLVAAVAAGSVESFEALYRRYAVRAQRVALSVCHDEGRAQDAVQEAFLSIWQASATFSAHRGTVATWLLSIVRHRAIDVARRDGRHAVRRPEDAGPMPTPGDALVSDVVLRHELKREVQLSLSRLPAAQREAITLAYFGQLSQTEIARALDLAPGTVKGRIRLGLDKLRVAAEQP